MRLTREDLVTLIEQTRENPSIPDFKISNRPLINLCHSFASFYKAVHDPNWLLMLEEYDRQEDPNSIKRVFLSRSDYLTHVVGKTILDFETYLDFAITWTGYLAGIVLNKEAKRPPTGTSVIDYLLDQLPQRLHPDFTLQRSDPECFAFFRTFYKTVRNRLFHGCTLTEPTIQDFLHFMEWYQRGYLWLTGWKTLYIYLEPIEDYRLRVRAEFPSQADWEKHCKEFRSRRHMALNL